MLDAYTVVLVLREFTWEELVDFKHSINHSSALLQHPHNDLEGESDS